MLNNGQRFVMTIYHAPQNFFVIKRSSEAFAII